MTVRLPRPLSLLLVLAASATISAMPHIFARQDTCAAGGLSSCSKNLPDSFCCPQKSRCISLAGDTSALCCPEGRDCERIKPIICDTAAQDVDKFPTAPIKTTVFDVELKKCNGDRCCPFGYTCAGTECLRDEDQSKAPQGDAKPEPSGTATTVPSPSKTGVPSVVIVTPGETNSAPADSVVPSDESTSPGPNTAAIIGGVVGGIVFLLIVAALIFFFTRRANKRHGGLTEKPKPKPKPMMHKKKNSFARNSTPFASIISDPILRPDNCVRTDFIRKESSARSPADREKNHNNSTSRGGHGLGIGLGTGTGTGTTRPGPERPHHLNIPRIEIPNPFDSPTPTERSAVSPVSFVSQDDRNLRTGDVGAARLAPIRAMRSDRRSRCLTQGVGPSSESIDVFADPITVRHDKENRLTRGTTFTDLMYQADLGEVHKGKQRYIPYVPGATPRI
jgi:hypothetical protein